MKNIIKEKITRRACRAEDISFVTNLSKQNMKKYIIEVWGDWNARQFKDSLKKENIKIISYAGKKVAFSDITRDNDTAYLHNLQIMPPFQGKGLGKIIMENVETREKKAGTKKIQAKVFKNNPAKLFYRKLGYRTIKRSGGVLLMEKILED